MLKLENNTKLTLGEVVGEIAESGIMIYEAGVKLNCVIQNLAFDLSKLINDKSKAIQIVCSLMDWDWEAYYEELDKDEEYQELHLALVELSAKMEIMVDLVNMGLRIVGWERPEVSLNDLRNLERGTRSELLS